MNYIIPFIRKDQEQIIQINLCEIVISFSLIVLSQRLFYASNAVNLFYLIRL